MSLTLLFITLSIQRFKANMKGDLVWQALKIVQYMKYLV
jgi:hypothetical protein